MVSPMVAALFIAASVAATGSVLATDVPLAGPTNGTDGTIERRELSHLPGEDDYRSPGGVVEAGTPVRLRLRAAAGDLTAARAFFRDWGSGQSWQVEMESIDVETDEDGDRFDYWQVEVQTRPFPMILDYGFIAWDGTTSCWLFGATTVDGASENEPGRSAPWRLIFDRLDVELPRQVDPRDLEVVYREKHMEGDASSRRPSDSEDPGAAEPTT